MWVLVCFALLVAVVVVAAVVFVVVVTIVVVILVVWSLLLLLVVVAVVVAVGEAKKPVKLCRTKKTENWRNYQGQKAEKQTTEFASA